MRAIRKERMSNKSPDIGSHFTRRRRRRPFLTGNIGHYEIEREGRKERTERKEERGKEEMGSCTQYMDLLALYLSLSLSLSLPLPL